ncbi:MAG TPA: transcriptional regulator [Gammaproteobacteria bacterium]|jgi:putative FmdB family regulatory protein|nr:transcriptional regulator [Gammaproteobacteria bacterium]
MPIYQYACDACGHQLEALQKISDDRLTECPECHKPKLVKQLTAAAFRLKGTGWYETDFKNSGTKPAVESSSDKAAAPVKSAKSGAAGASKASSNA